jgi:hypothetical protein
MAWLLVCRQIVDTALSHPSSPAAAIATAGHLPAAIIGNIPSLRQEKGNSIFLQYAPQKPKKREKQAHQPPTRLINKSGG